MLPAHVQGRVSATAPTSDTGDVRLHKAQVMPRAMFAQQSSLLLSQKTLDMLEKYFSDFFFPLV